MWSSASAPAPSFSSSGGRAPGTRAGTWAGTWAGRWAGSFGAHPAERAGWILAGVWTVFVAVKTWDGALLAPAVLAAALVGVGVGLGATVLATLRRGLPVWGQLALLGVLAVLTLARAYVAVVHDPSYGTDEIAFDQYAAQLLLHGRDPYGRSMTPALALFQVPDVYRTWTLSGGFVSRLSYPAASFLLYVPALLAGIHMQAAVVTDVLFWIAAAALLWVLLPRPARFAAVLLLGAGMLFGNAVGGVSDVLYLPFAMVALWRWDRFSAPGLAPWQRFAGPVCLGVACSVKQTPWFWVPFLVAGVALEARRRGIPWRGEATRYLTAVAGTFAVVNGPFLVAAPGAFVRGMLTPLTAPTVPGGQGLVGWAMFTAHGGDLQLYSLTALLAALAAWLWFCGSYPSSKAALVAVVAAVFFLPSRSFDEYFLEAAPLVLVAPLAVMAPRPAVPRTLGGVQAPPGTVTRPVRAPSPAGPTHRGRWQVAAAVSLAVAVAAAGAALLVRPPVRLSVVAEHSTGQLDTVDRLTVTVQNRSSAAVTPHYATDQTGQQSAFWNVASGPRRLRPGERATVVLAAPDVASMPSLLSGFVVNAYLAHPAAVATSKKVILQHYGSVLTPLGVGHPVPVGRPVTLHVQLTDTLGAPVHRAGVHVDLGQVVYGQTTLGYGEASINGSPEGATPVGATTDAAGRATFVVRGVQAPRDPVFFEAWVVPPGGLPTSYSNQVDVQFVAAGVP